MNREKIVLIILVCFITCFFVFSKVAVKTYDDHMDETNNNYNESTANSIISQIENAYALARVKNNNYPTLKQVQTEYNASYPQIKWESDYAIGSGEFKCDVKVDNNNLKVTCLGKETTSEMILSNEIINNSIDDNKVSDNQTTVDNIGGNTTQSTVNDNKESDNQTTVDSEEYLANKNTVDLVLHAVKLAYTTAMLDNLGTKPTLQQVKASFNSDVSTWNSDYVIKADNFNCNVEVINNNLKVNCLGKETNTNLILSN